jgi:glucose-6-phosphate 1-epimerase
MLEQLNQRFAIPHAAEFVAGPNGLPKLEIRTPAADADIYLHGAHVTHYQRREEPPILWLSEKSWFEANKPIRGGVPVIFPWFGARANAGADPKSPAHGFARLTPWLPESVTQADDGAVTAELSLRSNDQTRATWPHDFELRYRVTVGPELAMLLRVRNTGGAPFRFEEALHTYFAVADVRQVIVRGLEGTTYLDKAPGAPAPRASQGEKPITLGGETDRVYLDTRAACALEDPGHARRVAIEKAGSDATVVWNPWVAKAKAMPDFGDDEWPGMICIETANVIENAIELAAGAEHEMKVVVR